MNNEIQSKSRDSKPGMREATVCPHLVVGDEAAPRPHAAVVGALHQDHLAVRAARVERVPLAVLVGL